MSGTGSNRGQWLLLVLSLLVATALVLVAACGGDDDEEEDDGDSEPTATESADNGDGDETPEATDDSGGDGGDGASDLSALAAEYDDFVGVVKYETTGFGDSFSSMKIYKGEDRSRIDYESDDGTGTIITTPDAFYICGEGACIKYPTGDTSLDPTAGLTAFISADAINEQYGDLPDGVSVDESSEEIAGVDATCYAYSGDIDETEEGDENGAICFSESGLLLRLDSSVSGGGSFEAVEAEEGVSESDFEPPFPVTEIPNFGQ
jgi:hypothetical protein